MKRLTTHLIALGLATGLARRGHRGHGRGCARSGSGDRSGGSDG